MRVFSDILEGLTHTIHSLVNQFHFGVRSRCQWTKGVYPEPIESKEGLFTSPTLLKREACLIATYHLEDFQKKSSQWRYLENLTVLDHLTYLFEDAIEGRDFQASSWLDVGTKNGSYLQAIHAFLSQHTESFQIEGLELDGYRLLEDGYSRWDYAQTFIRSLPNTFYQVGDVMQVEKTYDVVSCFLPFVFLEPCLAWGLPKNYFNPESFLKHLVNRIAPGGWLLIVNQGQDEAEAQEELFRKLHDPSLKVEPIGALPPSFLTLKHTRYGWRCQKSGLKMEAQPEEPPLPSTQRS